MEITLVQHFVVANRVSVAPFMPQPRDHLERYGSDWLMRPSIVGQICTGRIRGLGSAEGEFVLPGGEVGLCGKTSGEEWSVGVSGEFTAQTADGFAHSSEDLGF